MRHWLALTCAAIVLTLAGVARADGEAYYRVPITKLKLIEGELPAEINIAVDECGAVNVFYYQYWGSGTDQGGDWYLYFPRYLRIPNFPSTTGMFMSSLGPGSYLRANEFMGDYARMACTGNELYIPYPIKESDGTWNIYANHVHVCSAIADVNSDNLVNQSDLSLFTSWFTSADPRADLNQDGVVDAADFMLFSASYACACNP